MTDLAIVNLFALRRVEGAGGPRWPRQARQQDEDTGQAVVAFVTLEGGAQEGDANESFDSTWGDVATKIGKLARPKRFIYADDLPKTRSCAGSCATSPRAAN